MITSHKVDCEILPGISQDSALGDEERTWQVRDKLRALLSEKEYREFFEREHGTLQRIVGDDNGECVVQFVC